MLQWIISKALGSKAFSGLNNTEIAKNLKAAREMSVSTRNAIARDYYGTIQQYENVPLNEREEHLKAVLSYAKEKRHAAISSGAKSEHHPLWNTAATIENIALTLLLEHRGKLTTTEKAKSLDEITIFIDQNLSDHDRELMDAEFLAQ
jgi:hypothetical protein